MPKMAIVGAGSLVFTRTLVTDLLHQEATEGSELRLVDIDPARLEAARRSVESLIERAHKKATVIATLDAALRCRHPLSQSGLTQRVPTRPLLGPACWPFLL